MADGRHFQKVEKSLYLSHGLTDRHAIWQDYAFLLSAPYRQLKFNSFDNPRSRTAAILKTVKSLYISNGLTYRGENLVR